MTEDPRRLWETSQGDHEAMLWNWTLETQDTAEESLGALSPGSTPPGKALNLGQQQQLLSLEIWPEKPAQASESYTVLCIHTVNLISQLIPGSFFSPFISSY